jgi:hypothetical protein
MKCPQCHEETPDDALNCTACHINLYWAKNHYEDLAKVRGDQGLERSTNSSPGFLVQAHDDAVAERGRHPEAVAKKMRTFARKMQDPES